MDWNDRKWEATYFNFLSFIHIDIKGFWFNFGQKIFTGLEMLELKIWSIFFILLCSGILDKCRSVTFMIWHFEASKYFWTKFEWEPRDININEWQMLKTVGTLFLSFQVTSKMAFIYCLFTRVWIHMHISSVHGWVYTVYYKYVKSYQSSFLAPL